jgi:hypothetical protein
MKIAAGLAGLFKQKILSRVRRKRLNTAAGLPITRAKNYVGFARSSVTY